MGILRNYGFNVYSDYKNNYLKYADQDNWDPHIEAKIVQFIIEQLLNIGWQLMDREGLWFKRLSE